MPLDRAKLVSSFFAQSETRLTLVKNGLARLLAAGKKDGSLADLRRSIHSVKGDATVLGIDGVVEAAREIEEGIDNLLAGAATFGTDSVRPLLNKCDTFAVLMGRARAESQGGTPA